MKTFQCQCGNTVHFENTVCLQCKRVLGFAPDLLAITSLSKQGTLWQSDSNGKHYRQCANHIQHNVCNWLVPSESDEKYCSSCSLNQVIPNLYYPENITLWHRIETAKRRLLYSLMLLRLPITSRKVDRKSGLAFEFLADASLNGEFTERDPVMTGHRSGLITINIAEANASFREQMREQLNEGYRTLLGHFRHESGHYYWERLKNHPETLAEFRQFFGDEREDYKHALETYYRNGAQQNWETHFISAYASSHPWEDWAETWAHFLHIVDTIETAYDFGFYGQTPREPPSTPNSPLSTLNLGSFHSLLVNWGRLSMALNAMNRSIGLPDAYPFTHSKTVIDKLHFVHRCVAFLSEPDINLAQPSSK